MKTNRFTFMYAISMIWATIGSYGNDLNDSSISPLERTLPCVSTEINNPKISNLVRKKNWTKAIEFIMAHPNESGNSASRKFLIAKCMYQAGMMEGAAHYLDKSITKVINYDPLLQLMLARNEQLSNHFLKARAWYQVAMEHHAADDNQIKQWIAECNYAINSVQSHNEVRISNAGKILNTSFSDFAAVPRGLEDGVFFRSNHIQNEKRKDSYALLEGYTQVDNPDKVFCAEGRSGNWTTPMTMPGPVSKQKNVGILMVTRDENKYYYYSDKNCGDLYLTERSQNGWRKGKSISKKINSEWAETSLWINDPGDYLLFVSERPGGMGGKDIYYSTKTESDKWSAPLNLGVEINSEKDEESPWVSADGSKLFFSSKGHETIGGYDVFVCTRNESGSWSEPRNMGIPVNSPADDCFFVTLSDENNFYLSSSRYGGEGGMDIYYGKLNQQTKPNEEINNNTNEQPRQCYDVINGEASRNEYKLRHPMVILLEPEAEGSTDTNTLQGEEQLALNKECQLISGNDLLDNESSTEGNAKIQLITSKNNLQSINLSFGASIFFEEGSSEFTVEAVKLLTDLCSILKINPGEMILVSGYSDNTGADKFNKELSGLRAEATGKFLLAHGISQSKLILLNFGESFPASENSSEEGRKLNRRVEIKLIP